jgi:long-chain fatty acid transport protein
MEARRQAVVVAAILPLVLSGMAYASGFNIYEAGARATALGGAFTATADDGSAIFYNPAGLAFLEGTRIDLNAMPILPDARFTGLTPPEPAATGQTRDLTFLIPGAYFTHNPGSGLAYGIGVCAPFGLGVEWESPATWIGRRSSYDVDLATLYITPALAIRISEQAAVSFGADIGWGHVELNRFSAIELGPSRDLVNVIDQELKGNSRLNVTPCFGLLAHPHEDLSVGVMYRAAKTLEFRNRDATLVNVAPEIVISPAGTTLHDVVDDQIAQLGGPQQKVSTKVHLPSFYSFGIAYQIHQRARLEFDAVRFEWSHFSNLILNFTSPSNPDQLIREDYADIWQLRCGLDVDLAPELKAMFGYVHDNSPQPTAAISPLLPDADREDFSFGLQWRRDRWQLVGSYMAVLFHERSNLEDGQVVRFEETQPAGAYDSLANIFGIGVGYSF